MSSIFDKWNKTIDTEGLANDVKEAEKTSGKSNDYPEVPVGSYEVKIEKMEIRETGKGEPKVFVQFRILKGRYQNNCLFWHQTITQGFQIGIANKFLRSLDAYDGEIEFIDYEQYNNILLDIMENIDKDNLEYLVDYKTNKAGFANYTIKAVYEK